MLQQFTTGDGVTLAYRDLGPREGTPIALCHGLAASGRQFEADAAWFSARGYRVIVPDLRGHGRSGRPEALEARHFGIARMAEDMLGMLDDARIGAIHWVGNSLGGIVALDMAGRAPGRLLSLATFGTAYALALPGIVPPVFPLVYGLLGRRIVSAVTARITTPDPAGRALVSEMLEAFDPHVGQAVAENVRRYDLTAAALGYPGPILMIRCGRDRGVNAALGPTLAAMEGRANFRRVELPHAGHCANLDQPDQVRKLLEAFWRGEEGAPAPA